MSGILRPYGHIDWRDGAVRLSAYGFLASNSKCLVQRDRTILNTILTKTGVTRYECEVPTSCSVSNICSGILEQCFFAVRSGAIRWHIKKFIGEIFNTQRHSSLINVRHNNCKISWVYRRVRTIYGDDIWWLGMAIGRFAPKRFQVRDNWS